MTTYEHETSPTEFAAPPTWLRILLGIVMILGGIFVLGDVALASIVSALLIGAIAIVAGAFEIVHAFWTKGWGGFLWQILLGALYVGFGLMLVSQPVAGALALTWVLGVILVASGAVRIFAAAKHWSKVGWVMVASGLFGMLAGVLILVGWPATGIWVLGLFLGIDLISHGVAWLVYGWLPAGETA